MAVSEEQVRVEKRPTVREEVSVGKRQVQNTKSISDDVKHEELRVEKDGDNWGRLFVHFRHDAPTGRRGRGR